MARKKHLINIHTSTGTTEPTTADLHLGEIAVQHTSGSPALWIKMGASESSTDYEKFIGETEIIAKIEDNKILGSGYTYSGIPWVNSATSIADAYSALTEAVLDDEVVIATSINELRDKTNVLSAGTISEFKQKNHNIPYVVQSGSVFTGTTAAYVGDCPDLDELVEGQSIVFWTKQGSKSGNTGDILSACTLNLQLSDGTMTGPKIIYLEKNTKVTSHIEGANNVRLTYHENATWSGVTGLTGWWMDYSYDANTDVFGYQLRYNNTQRVTTSQMYRYRLMFTSADKKHWVPANSATSTNATDVRTPTTTPIDPFGPIAYYGTTTIIASGASPGSTAIYTQISALTLGYSFVFANSAMTAKLPVYLKCTPQGDGSAIIDATTPVTQSLPTSEDGKLYIFLGVAANPTTFEFYEQHPVYEYKNGHVRHYQEDTDVQMILGSGYTYSGIPWVNSATSIADAYSALTKTVLDNEYVVSAALNNLNGRTNSISSMTAEMSVVLNGKQDTIGDLDAIRNGAYSGASAWTAVNALSAGTISEFKKETHNIPYVVTNETGTTARLHATCTELDELKEGQSIILHLTCGTTSASTEGLANACALDLILSDGTSTGYKIIYYGATTKVTTHYGGGNDIRLTFHSGLTIGTTTGLTGWWIEGNFYSDSDNKVGSIYERRYAGDRLTRYQIIGIGEDERLYPLTKVDSGDYNTGTTKPVNTVGFRPERFFYRNTTAVVAANTVDSAQIEYLNIHVTAPRYTFNSDLLGYRAIYLQGTYNPNKNLFYLDSASTTSFYAQVPTNTANITLSSYLTAGKYYIYLGATYSSNNYFQLSPTHELFYFDGTNLIKASTQLMLDNEVVVASAVNDIYDKLDDNDNRLDGIDNRLDGIDDTIGDIETILASI